MVNITISQLAVYAVKELESGRSVSQVGSQLAGFLMQERRTRDASSLFRYIEKEMSIRGSDQVVITSAHSVEDSVKAKLAVMLSANNPVFTEDIDPSMIGGVKARSGEKEVDLTIRGRVKRFKQQVIQQGK